MNKFFKLHNSIIIVFINLLTISTFIYLFSNPETRGQQLIHNNNNFTIYNNTNIGISIQYPSNWLKIEQSFNDKLNVVSFLSTEENHTNQNPVNINIIAE